MTKSKFEPILIGIDNEKIEKEKDNWEYAISLLNETSKAWKEVFAEVPNLNDMETLISSKDPKYLLKSLTILKDPFYSKMLESPLSDINKIIAGSTFPDFSHILNLVATLDQKLRLNHMYGFMESLNKLFVNGNFILSDSKLEEITANFTYYTKTIQQNVVVIFARKMAEPLNLLNELGGRFTDNFFDNEMMHCFKTVKGVKTYGETKFPRNGYNGNPENRVPKIEVSPFVLRDDTVVMSLCSELTDEEAEELIEKITII